MGIDLTFIPIEQEQRHLCYGHPLLCIDADYDLYTRIETKETRPVLYPFACHVATIKSGKDKGESCYGEIEEDAYGKELRAIRVEDLLEAWPVVRGKNVSRKNAAVRAYLSMLDRRSWVALYWH